MVTMIRRKVFISHYKGDRIEVDNFIKRFGHLFITKVLGANDNDEFINSTDTEYVMRRIRQKYLDDSTVTIVLLGSCTHSRRYVDWEIKSSLRYDAYTLPNGLIGIVLPSQNNRCYLPARFENNWDQQHYNCYARFYPYPSLDQQLVEWIEDAYIARTQRKHLINNSRVMLGYNAKCNIHGATH
ncbi:TIR domain-containing protein [Acinetobacter sp. SwsAc7]|jgi:hypothetical protein|nr:TIR domain-containing protein [Acinetobacter sp. SwsAc7]